MLHFFMMKDFGMTKLHYTYVLLITTLLSFNTTIFGMLDSLCPVEKEIIFQVIDRIGIDSIIQQLNESDKDLIVELKLSLANADRLTALMVKAVTEKEKIYGYRPNTKKKT